MMPVRNVQSVRKIEEVGVRPTIGEAIQEIAMECSMFAHHAVPHSSTGARLLRPIAEIDPRTTLAECEMADLSGTLRTMRQNKAVNENNKLNAGVQHDSAYAEADAEHLMESIRTGIGNCTEKAKIAGIFLLASIQSALEQRGFSEDEILDALIEVRIEDNRILKGDHAVCVLSYRLNHRKQELLVDPWMNGIVYKREEAQAAFTTHFMNNHYESAEFTESTKWTKAINNESCISKVMHCAQEILGVESLFEKLFSYCNGQTF